MLKLPTASPDQRPISPRLGSNTCLPTIIWKETFVDPSPPYSRATPCTKLAVPTVAPPPPSDLDKQIFDALIANLGAFAAAPKRVTRCPPLRDESPLLGSSLQPSGLRRI
jgi:hypothetical protein